MPKSKKKIGRPKLPKGAAKSGAIQVRLDLDVRKRVEMAAKAKKQKVSAWIREAIDVVLQS